jgi:ACS family glucarate transporter-like MFS transporter
VGDWLVKRQGLAFSRRFIAMTGLGLTGLSFLVAATVSSGIIASVSLVAGSLFFSFYPIVAFSTCVDIGGNRAGSITGIMVSCGQVGSFLLSIFFGRIVDTMHNFNFPLYIIATFLLSGAFVWLAVDPRKKITLQTDSSQLAVARENICRNNIVCL